MQTFVDNSWPDVIREASGGGVGEANIVTSTRVIELTVTGAVPGEYSLRNGAGTHLSRGL